MKKLDIEKLECKTPHLPDDFFQKMQENVLDKTTRKKSKPIFRLNTVWYSAAAAVVVFLGFGYFYLTNPKTSQDREIAQQNADFFTEEKNIIADEKIADTNYIDQNFANYIETAKTAVISDENNILPTDSPKSSTVLLDKMEDVLDLMTENEITDLASNYEQDPYLELY